MKAALGLACAGGTRLALANDQLAPAVDRRVEFASIVFRLAGVKEFAELAASPYTQAIDRHFHAYSRHPAISYVKQMNEQLGRKGVDVGAWEVLSLALHVNRVPALEPLVAGGDANAADDWDNRELLQAELLNRLRAFCRDAHCQEFFDSQAEYFESIERAITYGGMRVCKDWFERFLAVQPLERYAPIVSLLGVGDLSYIRVNFTSTRRNTHTIVALAPDANPRWPLKASRELVARSTVHEYTHAFVNQLVEQQLASLVAAAERLLALQQVATLVRGTFYDNPRYLLYESLVRAISIRYFLDNAGSGFELEKELLSQERAGFSWMRGLLGKLDEYRSHRERYSTFRAFMPEIVKFFDREAIGESAWIGWA